MQKISAIIIILLLNSSLLISQVSITNDGTPPDNSAMLDVKSTGKGFLPPRMTNAELHGISSPANGLIVYCTDCGSDGSGTMATFVSGEWFTFNLNCLNPFSPVSGIHAPSPAQIVWNWNAVSGATGYKWNTTDDYASADDLGNSTTFTETGLTCLTSYTRYVWSYSSCGLSASTALTMSTSDTPPASPTAGTHIPSPTQIEWVWNAGPDATGYKWNTTDDFSSATDLGANTTTTETGLTCNTSYTRYVWAYSACGISMAASLTQSTADDTAAAPEAGTHGSTVNQITWNWNTVTGATGYKWNNIDNYGTATDMGSETSKTEEWLSCGTNYTRYVWAYNICGISIPTTLTQTTSVSPFAPEEGTHVPSQTQIVWNWNAVSGATGYKWNISNDYNTALNMGSSTTMTESYLAYETDYTRFVWAYNTCGYSSPVTLTETTLSWTCGYPIEINHVAGTVAPVDKSTNYGTVTNIPGEPAKCWITSNLGADHQATAVADGTEASAGWYWQFNHLQGYKYTTTRTPNTTWITSIVESSNWTVANDPCSHEIGGSWRIPTDSEWINVDASGGWNHWMGPWNSGLKIHVAGCIHYSDGLMRARGQWGYYWSSIQYDNTYGRYLYIDSGTSVVINYYKASGYSIRCLRE